MTTETLTLSQISPALIREYTDALVYLLTALGGALVAFSGVVWTIYSRYQAMKSALHSAVAQADNPDAVKAGLPPAAAKMVDVATVANAKAATDPNLGTAQTPPEAKP